MASDFAFSSRRSTVYGRRGMVATSQPLAAAAGIAMLDAGGSAADAAVAAVAALSVVEPCSTGPGGDLFALHYEAATGEITALNGSGRAPAAADREEILRLMYARMPLYTAHTVTVPGAVRAWADLLERHGTMPLSAVLAPAIRLAEGGYPATEWIAHSWARQVAKLLRTPGWESGDVYNGPPQESGRELLVDGRAPRPGELVRLPALGATLRSIGEGGPDAFYRGDFARRAAAHVQRYGGWLAESDLAGHRSEWTTPVSVRYRDVVLHECPPNGQGVVASIAARLLDGFDVAGAAEADRWHLSIEAMRLAFADGLRHVADPAAGDLPLAALLDEERLARRRAEIRPDRAARFLKADPAIRAGDDTVYAAAVDEAGNAASVIQSLYMGFGTGLVPPGTGVSLQNRGSGFHLNARHPNCLAPGRRPYHTIIPALTTRDGALDACFGVMGGFMQPQGHLQMLVNLNDRRLTPQEALDAPRWQIVSDSGRPGAPDPTGPVLVEEGAGPELIEELARRGHRPRLVKGAERLHMGGGQIIRRLPTGVLAAGSDPRKDGHALPQL